MKFLPEEGNLGFVLDSGWPEACSGGQEASELGVDDGIAWLGSVRLELNLEETIHLEEVDQQDNWSLLKFAGMQIGYFCRHFCSFKAP